MKSKLGVTYNVFNGHELLECSIRSIRDSVDYINVVYQEYSWTKIRADENLVPELLRLKKIGLIDNIIKFECDIDKENLISRMRCKKTNLGLKDLRKNHCTHFMMMDADEFYMAEEFQNAKEYVIKNGITHSACSIYDYRPSPCFRERDAQKYSVSFIFKMTFLSRVVGSYKWNNMPCYMDVYRAVPFIPLLHKFFYLNSVSMHHMTGVRKRFSDKLENTISNFSEHGRAAIKKYGSLQNKLEHMTDEEIVKEGYISVEDRFHILETMKKW